jgi:hypothetical protein
MKNPGLLSGIPETNFSKNTISNNQAIDIMQVKNLRHFHHIFPTPKVTMPNLIYGLKEIAACVPGNDVINYLIYI